ncbi:Ubiquinone/menaquinone biosynthesis methyltransferase UbiE/ COQ5 [Staphylococcus saccharolyticus]|uniref:Ubiquinone/menaquinone biosynthesis methyltransferase UbiE/ COQ5 n=1 Tax=Staphylococcus saccharolyticus TaxID=33028 RepID=A0A380H300_9STAP|nr:Ubiquinone/menaquinone biosynthesis methyltransferase UbiE/ COQ5 [Staphylococcus saccharolyticus]
MDMLSIARQKSNQVTWIEGDMTQFELKQKFNIITIFCDSLNYLSTDKDVKKTFQTVFHHLSDNGVFIFDVHTAYKMNTLFNNQSYIDETDNVFVGWDAIKGKEPLSVYHEMTFFVMQQDRSYQRFDESHYQRTFYEDTYKNFLKQVGFTDIKTFTDFNIEEHNENAHRLFFVVQK